MIVSCLFKRKTAYELRISDWSSDVCSSDLAVERIAFLALGKQQGSLGQPASLGQPRQTAEEGVVQVAENEAAAQQPRLFGVVQRRGRILLAAFRRHQIGRAHV